SRERLHHLFGGQVILRPEIVRDLEHSLVVHEVGGTRYWRLEKPSLVGRRIELENVLYGALPLSVREAHEARIEGLSVQHHGRGRKLTVLHHCTRGTAATRSGCITGPCGGGRGGACTTGGTGPRTGTCAIRSTRTPRHRPAADL